MKDRTYSLNLTIDQARAVMRACETFARIGLGQFDNAIGDNIHHMPNGSSQVSQARELADQIIDLVGGTRYTRRGGPGITNKEVPNCFRTAYDVKQALSTQMARDGLIDGGRLGTSSPITCGDEKLPEVNKNEVEK